MRRVGLAIAVVATACGRVGFEPIADDLVPPFNPPQLAWSQAVGGAMSQAFAAVTATSDGHIVVTGHSNGPVDAGGGVLPYVGGEDVMIVGYDAAGAYRWARAFGSPLDDNGFDLTADAFGNVYVSGAVRGSVDFGGGPVAAVNQVDMFVASYDPDGAYRWGRIWGSSFDGEIVFGLASDGTKRVYAIGWYKGPIDFGDGSGTHTPIHDQDVILLALDLDGNPLLARSYGGVEVTQGQKIAVGTDGSLAITGLFGGTIDLGNGEVTTAGSHDTFLARLDSDGTPVWSATTGGIAEDRGIGVAIGADRAIYQCGEYRATVDFGLGPLTSLGLSDGFVARYDDDGPLPTWVQTTTGTSGELIDSCAAMQDGRIAFSGQVGNAGASVGGMSLASTGMNDFIVAALDRDGSLAWLRHYGSPANEVARDLAVGADGVILVAGNFSAPIDFGDGLRTPTSNDAFLLRLEPTP